MNITFKSILNKYILIEITYLDKKGNILELIQFDGKIIEANENEGILIERLDNKETFSLPPDLSFIKIAEPGEYILKSTGKIVTNPDFISTLIIEKRRYKNM